MPLPTGTELIAKVRDYADEPSDGDGTKAYITDAHILDRLTKEVRRVYRRMARSGHFFNKTLLASVINTSTSSISLGTVPMIVLNVSNLSSATSRRRLPRLPDTEEPLFSGTNVMYWRPRITVTGGSNTCNIELFPAPVSGTIQVWYIPDVDTMAAGTQTYLSPAQEDAVVLGAAMRCYVKTGESNAYLKAMYEEALSEIDADAADFSAGDGAVIRNVDNVYTPGDDQGTVRFDPSDYWYVT